MQIAVVMKTANANEGFLGIKGCPQSHMILTTPQWSEAMSETPF
jgi:hypothetical protein